MAEPALLIGVGAQKSGTTWMYDYLSSHPDCHLRPFKELHYFDSLCGDLESVHHETRMGSWHYIRKIFVRSAIRLQVNEVRRLWPEFLLYREYAGLRPGKDGKHEDYLDFLRKGLTNQKLVGDITPSYMGLSKKRFREVLELTPDVRFLLILRDPLDRLWSQIRMSSKSNNGDETLDSDLGSEALRLLDKHLQSTNKHFAMRSNYVHILDILENVVPKDQSLVVFYEELFDSTQGPKVLRQITDFLSIAPLDGNLNKSVHGGRVLPLDEGRKNRAVRKLRSQYEYCEEYFGEALPERWRHNIARIEAA